jgi:hypothetical protein
MLVWAFARNKSGLRSFELVDDTILPSTTQSYLKNGGTYKIRFWCLRRKRSRKFDENWDRMIGIRCDSLRGDTGCFATEQLADYACSDVYWTYRLRILLT